MSDGATIPYVTVVIPTVGRPEFLVPCIEGIVAGTFQDFEIVIVDQSKDDRSRSEVARRWGGDPRVRYHHSDVTGAARARNFGFERARGEVVAFIDDDAVPVPGWLGAYADGFRTLSPPVGMIGGRIVLAWDRPRPRWYPRRFLPLLGMHDAGDQLRPFPAGDFPVSANFALRRSVMAEVGAFDIRLGFDVGRKNPLLGGEDSHLGTKVANAGHPVYYHPGAEVRHFVRSAKLSPRYFMRRCYWHGRTTVQLRLRADGDRRSWLRTWLDSRAKRREQPAVGRAAEPPRPPSEVVMQLAAWAAFAVGVAAETAAVRLGGDDPSRSPPAPAPADPRGDGRK